MHSCASACDLVSLFILQYSALREHSSTTGGDLPCHISCGDLLSGLAVVAVRFKASLVQWDASVVAGVARRNQLFSVDSARHCGRLNQT